MSGKILLRVLGGVMGLWFVAFGAFLLARYGFSDHSELLAALSGIVSGIFFSLYAWTGKSPRFKRRNGPRAGPGA